MKKHYFITGGAGFIGSNYVARLLHRSEQVTVYDNLSRKGAPINLDWLHKKYGQDSFKLIVGDVRDAELLKRSMQDVDIVLHLAAQVAVTTSVIDPREDFEINALGTFNVLEAARASGRKPILLYSSTNKVYGGLDDIKIIETADHYAYSDLHHGVSESLPVDFHSPYGCSKGSGDQYVRDYFRIYGLPTVVFRQSCIYGPRQYGVEDQGFIAWFVIAALTGNKITIYGDGKQVRDILYVEDLLDAYDAAISGIELTAGQVYNIGGGSENSLAIWHQIGLLLETFIGHPIVVEHAEWRPGDQRVYISDIRKAKNDLGWQPKVKAVDGIRMLVDWVAANINLFK